MIAPARKTNVLTDLDNGIADYIHEINDLGYKTYLSCSAMKEDVHDKEQCPFICFCPIDLAGEELVNYYRFLGDCFYNSNWFVEYISHYVIGYLPWGLSDSKIRDRFERLIQNLKMMNFFNHSY